MAHEIGIDRQEFATWMSVLADRIGRSLKPPTVNVYYAILSRQLTSTEFVAAMTLAVERSKFWPSPAEIVEFVKPKADTSLAAAESLNGIRERIHKAGGIQFVKRDLYDGLDPSARRALSAVGGFGAIVNVTESEWPFLQKRWADAYTGAAIEFDKQEAAATHLDRAQARLSAPTRVGGLIAPKSA